MPRHDAVIGRCDGRARYRALLPLVPFLLPLLALAAPWAEAATKVWNNAAGGNWSTAANWTGGLPGFGDDVDITLAGTYTVTLDVGTDNLHSLVLGGASGTQTLSITANRLQIGSAPDATSTVNTNGVISLSDGTIRLFGATLGNAPRALFYNLGTIIHAGGTSTIFFDEYSNLITGLGGRIDVRLGTLAISGGQFFNFSNRGTLTLESGASFDFGPGLASMINTGTVLLNGNVLNFDFGTDYSQTGGVTDLGTAGGRIFAASTSISINASGGILKGSGRIASNVFVSGGATLAPGASPGLISITGDFNQNGGTFAVDLDGTDPGITYDQMQVGGGVSVAGPLVLSLGFSPVVGTVFVILDNEGDGAITGTFTGLPEGATIVAGTTTLRISYVGGTGNDVTLRVVAGAPAPTAIALVATPNPAILGQTVTLTATVTGVSPTGTVQFKDGAANLGAPVALAAGAATLATTVLSTASHPITAVYSGDANNLPSTSPVVIEIVNSAAAQTVPTLRDGMLVLLALFLTLSGAALCRRR